MTNDPDAPVGANSGEAESIEANEADRSGAEASTPQNLLEYRLLPLWRTLVSHPTALDVGAHKGDFSAALANNDFEVWAVEPNPTMHRRLSTRFMNSPRVATLNLAISDSRRILPLNLVSFEDDGAENTLYSGLKKHPTFEGFRYTDVVNVVAWPLEKLAATGLVPRDIGILKIDTEGSDDDVMRGMGTLRPEIIVAEFWNREFVFNRGTTGSDVPDYVDIVRPLGYQWHIIFYREGDSEAEGHLAGVRETPSKTWGNVVFFRSQEVYEATLHWLVQPYEALGDKELLKSVASRLQMLHRRASASAKHIGSQIFDTGDAEFSARPLMRKRVDVVVSPNEISSAHGTGILLSRLLDNRGGIVAMRSQTTYGGKQDITPEAAFVLPNPTMDRAEIVEQVARWLRPYDVDAFTCVPYFETDLLIGLAVKSITGAPMALWIMDDHCLYSQGIKREIMAEAIARADTVFAISPELRDAYEQEFGRSIHVLPPLVAAKHIRPVASDVPEEGLKQQNAVMIGNIWSQDWLEKLLATIDGSGWTITWYASNPDAFWLNFDRERAEKKGLVIRDQPPMADYIKAVSEAAFVVVPTAENFDADPAAAISRLSLPTRVPFVIATSGTPLLVIGNANAGVARFVRRFGLGEVCGYDAVAFKTATQRLGEADVQREIRKKAADLGPMFSSEGIYDYVSAAAKAKGYLAKDRFDHRFPALEGEYKVYREAPAPPSVHPAFVEIHECMTRLRNAGYRPDVVIDVGASTGIWSYYVSEVFPEARFLLVEPMFSRYPAKNVKFDFIVEEKAAGAKPGRITFNVSDDLYNSSLVAVSDVATRTEELDVEVTTVDKATADHGLAGSAILKVDVQYAEHLVLEGAVKTLADMADFVLLELTFEPPVPEARNFTQMVNLMDGYGFRPFDDVGGWRSPKSGFSDQKDIMFVRKGFSFKDSVGK